MASHTATVDAASLHRMSRQAAECERAVAALERLLPTLAAEERAALQARLGQIAVAEAVGGGGTEPPSPTGDELSGYGMSGYGRGGDQG